MARVNWRKRRLQIGLSLPEVARRAGMNKGRLSVVEHGVPPTPAQAAALEAVLSAAEKAAAEEQA